MTRRNAISVIATLPSDTLRRRQSGLEVPHITGAKFDPLGKYVNSFLRVDPLRSPLVQASLGIAACSLTCYQASLVLSFLLRLPRLSLGWFNTPDKELFHMFCFSRSMRSTTSRAMFLRIASDRRFDS